MATKLLLFFVGVSLVAASVDSCRTAIQKDLAGMIFGNSTDALKRFLYTGKDINDLGHYNSCLKTKHSRYLLVKTKIRGYTSYTGLCIPEACQKDTLLPAIDFSLPLKSSASQPIEIMQTGQYELGAGGVFLILLMSFFLLCILIGTYFDLSLMTPPVPETPKEEEKQLASISGESSQNQRTQSLQSRTRRGPRLPKYVAIFQCFSLISNWNSLFKQVSKDNTVILDGFRAISMAWIVIGHTYTTRMGDITNNPQQIPYMLGWKSTALLGYGPLKAVDTFFWLGGFLLGYLTLAELEKRRKVPWGMVIIKRLLRILPAYMFTLALINWFIPSLGSGPKWHQMETELTNYCDKYWWTNLLFINNFVPDGDGNFCMGQSWYLAVDMQLFLMSLVLIFLYYKLPKFISWILLLVLIFASTLARGLIAQEHHYTISVVSQSALTGKQMENIYIKPYCRWIPYFVGLFCGFIYCQYKKGETNDIVAQKVILVMTQMKKPVYVIFKIGLSFFFWALIIENLCGSDRQGDFHYFSNEGNEAILALQSFFQSTALTFIILPMLLGRITLVAPILGTKILTPFAKITFSTYLIHTGICRAFMASEDYGFNWTLYNITSNWVFNLVISFLGGLGLFLLVEQPMARMIGVLLSRNREQNQPLLMKS